MKRFRLVLLIVVLGGVAVWFFGGRKAHIRPGYIEGSGTIEATQVDLAPKVSGRVTVLRVKEGDQVSKGAVLAELDTATIDDQVAEAQANVTMAEGKVAEDRATLMLEREQVRTLVLQARSVADSNRARVPQAGENLNLQQATVATQILQTQAQLSSARSSLSAAEAGVLSAQAAIQTARANLETAQANRRKAEVDARRDEELFRQDAISAQQLDAVRTTLSTAGSAREAAQSQLTAAEAQQKVMERQRQAAAASVQQAQAALAQSEANRRTIPVKQLEVQAMQAQLNMAETGIDVAEAGRGRIAQREQQLAQARAALTQAQASLRVAQTAKRDATLTAPFDGIILSKNVEVGDLVAVGSPVVTIADLAHPYLRVFIGETDVGRVRLKAVADITVDSFPGRIFHGSVDEIRNQAEFIPQNVQTREERVKQVFGVRLAVDNPDLVLKPGLPADAEIQAVAP